MRERVPWVLAGTNLGPNVLELGPGPGLTTDLLLPHVAHLTVLELDPTLAESLSGRLRGSHVDVVVGDATRMPFKDEQFSAGFSCTMLHHVPSAELQDQVLSEMWRVLKPGGIFVGSDSLSSWLMKLIHIGDTLVPVCPATFRDRLAATGFYDIVVERSAHAFRFRARRPTGSASAGRRVL